MTYRAKCEGKKGRGKQKATGRKMRALGRALRPLFHDSEFKDLSYARTRDDVAAVIVDVEFPDLDLEP